MTQPPTDLVDRVMLAATLIPPNADRLVSVRADARGIAVDVWPSAPDDDRVGVEARIALVRVIASYLDDVTAGPGLRADGSGWCALGTYHGIDVRVVAGLDDEERAWVATRLADGEG